MPAVRAAAASARRALLEINIDGADAPILAINEIVERRRVTVRTERIRGSIELGE